MQNDNRREELSAPPGILSQWWRKHVFLFCAATFFFWAALYLYVPILPVYAQSLGASMSMVGTIVAAYSIPQLFFRIPIGILFDTVSQRKFLLALAILIASVGALGLGLAPSPWFLFLARTITGIGAAAWVIFAVYFTAYYPRGGVQKALGIINFVQGTAVVTATFSGGFIAEAFGSGYAFWGAVWLGVLGLIALLLAKEAVTPPAERASWQNFTLVATRPLLLIVSFMGVLAQFSTWAGLFGFVPVYAAQIGATKADLGIITMLTLASSALVALVVVRLIERLGNTLTILLGALLMGCSILVVPLIYHVYVLEAVMVVNGMGRGILNTILMILSVQAVRPQQRATAMGVYQATYAVGMILGPIVSGFLADNLGLAAVFYLSASICFVLAGIAHLPLVTHRGE